MPQPFPDENSDLWDRLVFPDIPGLTGRPSSLVCDYDGNRTTTVDSQLIVSGIGAIPGNLRRNPAKFSFTIKIWLPEQMRIYETVLSQVMTRSNELKAFRASHPALAQLDVHELYLEGATPLRRSSAREPLTSRWSTTERLPLIFITPQTIAGLQAKADQIKRDAEKPSKKPEATGPN